MKRILLLSPLFSRATKKLLKKQPRLSNNLKDTLMLLENDAFHPYLKTHKLKGDLEGTWACSVEYDLRIVFEFVQHEEKEAILLHLIGTHDEVY
ncbi:hypothetical protein BH24ACI2_BH24ACI2_00120 [soil metagenome]|nr:type II toxin-antitoxin system mRNA interferase toxin, RelE/StbE family [Acidobacteriota bacterium]